jgi:hypothetical protein
MEMSFREIITILHGMVCGGLLLLAFSGAFVGLCRFCTTENASPPGDRAQKILRLYLIAMVVLAWAAVLSGSYVVYPWYRAHPPEGMTNFAEYPRNQLLSSPTTSGWHNLGMEWKEYVAWFAPIALTMVAFVFVKYGRDLARHREVRRAAFTFTTAAFIAAGIAGTLGALLNKKAPVQGGPVIKLMEETK